MIAMAKKLMDPGTLRRTRKKRTEKLYWGYGLNVWNWDAQTRLGKLKPRGQILDLTLIVEYRRSIQAQVPDSAPIERMNGED
jgi:hypothetical protein